jgi:hypothetical protein
MRLYTRGFSSVQNLPSYFSSRVEFQAGSPLEQLARWQPAAGRGDALLVEFSLSPWWLDGDPAQALTAIYAVGADGELLCAVSAARPAELGARGGDDIHAWADSKGIAVFSPGRALMLNPTCIPKPWGQEVWFTGVEERGVCAFNDGRHDCPIPWLQAVMPGDLAGVAGEPLVLLKVLDPAPEEVTGDLYFELHEEKREVYVVTHVDAEAWPGGVGGIRFGFSQARLDQSESEAHFRREYLAAVQAYEEVRREIDALDGESPIELKHREQALRQAMNAFTHMRPLGVGDVVVVPLLMPHSLQHGVRTIEFQTPVYERQILSFAQRVLTQDHWDTADAVAQMRLTPPQEQAFEQLVASAGVTAERIVDFPDFEVQRVRVEQGASETLDAGDSYRLLMVVGGRLSLDGISIGPEQAAYVPPGKSVLLAPDSGEDPLILLLARPR